MGFFVRNQTFFEEFCLGFVIIDFFSDIVLVILSGNISHYTFIWNIVKWCFKHLSRLWWASFAATVGPPQAEETSFLKESRVAMPRPSRRASKISQWDQNCQQRTNRGLTFQTFLRWGSKVYSPLWFTILQSWWQF